MKKTYLTFLFSVMLLANACGPEVAKESEPQIKETGQNTNEIEVPTAVEDGEESQEKTEEKNAPSGALKGEPHQNFDHIVNSSTRYLIKEREGVAMVENCPGGYTYEEWRKDYECSNPAERSLEFEWLDGTITHVPQNVGLDYLSDLKWIGGSSFQQSFTPDFRQWLYLERFPSNKPLDFRETLEDPILWAFDTYTGEKQKLMSFRSSDGYSDAVRFVGFNEEGSSFAVLSFKENEPSYPKGGKLFVFDREKEVFTNKRSYDVPVGRDNSSDIGPFFYINWQDEKTIAYFDKASIEASIREMEQEDQEKDTYWLMRDINAIFLDPAQRNQSQHLRTLSVEQKE